MNYFFTLMHLFNICVCLFYINTVNVFEKMSVNNDCTVLITFPVHALSSFLLS